jgi:hypothetical protein
MPSGVRPPIGWPDSVGYGALCLAGVPAGADSRALFNQLLAWGLSMTVVGAVLCWPMFGVTTWFV